MATPTKQRALLLSDQISVALRALKYYQIAPSREAIPLIFHIFTGEGVAL
jgi:hypothetical protein